MRQGLLNNTFSFCHLVLFFQNLGLLPPTGGLIHTDPVYSVSQRSPAGASTSTGCQVQPAWVMACWKGWRSS